jgi:hypothetical protein
MKIYPVSFRKSVYLFLLLLGIPIQLCHANETASKADMHPKGLHGLLCTPTGEPVPNSTVTINNWIKATTAKDGTFFVDHQELEHQGPELLVMAGTSQNNTSYSCAEIINYVTGKENITIRLRPQVSIIGTVVAENGELIEGAEVVPYMNAGSITCHGTIQAGKASQTDANGEFRLTDLYPEMVYRLHIKAPGKERKWTDWIALPQRLTSDKIRVTLRDAPASVTGRVVDRNGDGVPSLVILGHPCIPDDTIKTDSEGYFKVANLLGEQEVRLFVNRRFYPVKAGTQDFVITVNQP